MASDDFAFSYEAPLHESFPALHDAQQAFLAQIDSLPTPDRKTHELIRMVCTVILGNQRGVERHARLAAEVGATWEEILGSVMLTVPGFGLGRATESLPAARAGFEAAPAAETDNEDE